MKIQADILAMFLKKTSVDGRIDTILLDCTEEGVTCKVRSVDNIMVSNSILKKDIITNYEPGQKLYIKNVLLLMKKLNDLVKGEVQLSIENNTLLVVDTFGSSFEDKLGSVDVIDNILDDETISNLFGKFDGGSILNKDVCLKIAKAISVMDSNVTSFSVKDKKLTIVNPSKIKEKSIVNADFDYKDVKTGLNSEMLKGILDIMRGDNLSLAIMGDKEPVLFVEKDETMIIRIVQAPVVKDE